VKSKDEIDLLNFIIRFANPFRKPCNRNSTNPNENISNPDCCETTNKITGQENIIPSYCDRILYNYNPTSIINQVKPLEYGSFYFEDPSFDSDHNVVYAKMRINVSPDPQKAPEDLFLTFVTLNQGLGLGDGEGADLNKFKNLAKDQDILAVGLQEIQSKRDVPLLISKLIQVLDSFELKDYVINGGSNKRVGLFVFVKKQSKTSKISKKIKECLVVNKPLFKSCNKSMVGLTLDVTILNDVIHINLFTAHLSFSQKKNKIDDFNRRKNQLTKVINEISKISDKQVTNYINILGGDLNFRNDDLPGHIKPEDILTSSGLVNQKNFKEPMIGQTYTFPPTCKYRTSPVKKTRRDVGISELEDLMKDINNPNVLNQNLNPMTSSTRGDRQENFLNQQKILNELLNFDKV
jgi:Asp-tRNA(Asn)/Glu-tRNA(Gln) amidotransferase C subunit